MQGNRTGNDYFDQAADSWDEKPMRHKLARSVAKAIREQVPLSKEMRAMEFGCGTGLVTMGLAPEVKQVLGVDTSSKMIGILDQKISDGRIENITTRRLDLLAGEMPEDRFDLVFTSMAPHHVRDTSHLLRIFNRLLESGGYLAMADLDVEDGGFHGDVPDVFHNGFDRQDLSRQMEEAGFSGIRSTTAHVMEKEHSRTGEMARFPVFLIVGRKTADL